MIRLKDLVNEIMDVPPVPPPATSALVAPATYNISTDFINYIKAMENPTKIGYRKGRWYPFKLRSGVSIGYGHAVLKSELKRMARGMTDAEMEALLKNDIQRAKQEVNEYLKKTYRGVNLHLPQKSEEMLIDFAYNLGGLEKFPKFVDAVVRGQKDKMKAEYKRYLNGKPLTLRNNTFYDRYLLLIRLFQPTPTNRYPDRGGPWLRHYS